ncbi:hypothetical protein VUR80DRAFT_6984 [Thermomyces stellatus]
MALRLLTLTALAATAIAKTDLEGCTYVDGVYTPPGRTDIPPYATRTWYVPDTGEICELLDCGGGRAPPKTDVPGCSNYKGTDTYSPRYMPSSTTAEAAGETGDADESEDSDVSGSEALTTPAPTKSGAAPAESGAEEGSDEEGSGENAEGGDDPDSGAAAVGASLGGVMAVAAALGLF